MARKRKKWKRLSDGIYDTTYGIRVIQHCAAGRAEVWYERGTPLPEMKRRREELKIQLQTLHPELRAGAHGRKTFNAAIKKYYSTLTIASRKSRLSELRAFADHWGAKLIRLLTTDDGKRIVKAWCDAGVSPKTILNRARGLSAMYHDLYGANARTPLQGVTLPRVTKRRPAYVPVETIQTVERNLRAGDVKTHARFLVLTATGCRPVHLKRALPQDVSLERRRWNIHGAKGGEPIPLPLNDDMYAAVTRFIEVDAFGDFDATAYAKAVRAAGWPADVPPYNAKHSLAMDLGAAGADVESIKDWLGHTDTATTRMYTGVLEQKLEAMSRAIDGRLGWASVLENRVGRQTQNGAKPRRVK